MDVPTHWNSSFLAWEHLLLIKDAINIVLTTLTVSTTSEARKDAKRLKQIQLTEDEWDLMKDLVEILGPFYETTEALGGSEYITISYMFLSILALMQNLTSLTSSSDEELNDEIDFETDDSVFNEDIRFIDAQEEEEEGPKKRKISINTPTNTANIEHKIKNALYSALLHYWDLFDSEVFLTCLLDPKCKKLRFATIS
ncbi:14779_t:CDS:1 [Gigaspora margarita]|uniref:14779_t:CDS:1 n=1 Tax=Gigaspora margarita TaxID=4874 RepID=A0ABN7VTN2_GIGMA|nr:14779_t:CDS:1 [Gigaspora margarita]